MDYKKLILATLGGAVVFMLVGWALWGILLHDFQTANTQQYSGLIKEAPNLGMTFISMIFTALAYSFIYHQWAGISTLKTGAKYGAMLAVLFGLGFDLLNASMLNLGNMNVLLSNIGANAIWGALGGGVIGVILGMGDKS